MSDGVNELPENSFSAILNFQLSSENGSHWVSLYQSDDETLYYFDSYGTPVQQQVIDKYKHIRAHDYKIQPLNSSMCGQLSLLVIYLLMNGFKYEDFVNPLKMTSIFISTDIAGNVLGGGSSNENNNNCYYPTKLQNDIDYINILVIHKQVI